MFVCLFVLFLFFKTFVEDECDTCRGVGVWGCGGVHVTCGWLGKGVSEGLAHFVCEDECRLIALYKCIIDLHLYR